METPTPSALSALIDDPAQGIVSRILLKERGGSATLFAFDAGQELSRSPHLVFR